MFSITASDLAKALKAKVATAALISTPAAKVLHGMSLGPGSVGQLHIVGHWGYGLIVPGDEDATAKRAALLAPYLSKNARIVLHGCQQGSKGFEDERRAALMALPEGTVLYAHKEQANPGQPSDFYGFKRVGKEIVELGKVGTDLDSIEEVMPRAAVADWLNHRQIKGTVPNAPGLEDLKNHPLYKADYAALTVLIDTLIAIKKAEATLPKKK